VSPVGPAMGAAPVTASMPPGTPATPAATAIPSTPAAPAPTAPAAAATLATATLKGTPGFVNTAQMTVYVFDLDQTAPGTSTCNGACTTAWPPIAPPSTPLSAGFSTITRSDGTKQLAFQGRPLYLFSGDGAPGQTNGDGLNAFGGLWHIARP
jgi:predicted lipoprotein with Yx(FWY)xxD motif